MRHLRRDLPRLRRRDPVANRGRLFGFGLGALVSVYVIMFALVPLLATQLAALMSPEAERALGRATLEQIRSLFSERETPVRFCQGESGSAALQKLYDRVAAGADLPQVVDLHVLDSPIVNAVALPGGQVVILEGLITAAASPEELAAVLAHELGHVANRDPTREALRSAGSIGVLGLVFGDFAGGSMALVLMNGLINADYSQAAEARADAFAYELLVRNDLPPAALASLFRRLDSGANGGGKILAHFASHPELGDRIAAAESAPQPDVARPILTESEWAALRWICGF
jgi:predicted Zn-dependent protease